ncbi:MAG TPA: hypothetical protein VG889_07765 [Rhizomicrobium sp.]|nr:hypothetical protein [Rhizomicrobium sp.]
MRVCTALLCLICLAAPARADTAAPWLDDQALAREAQDAIRTGGILALEKYRDRLERAVAAAPGSIALAEGEKPTAFILADGMTETMVAAALITPEKTGAKETVTLDNPYPKISFFLASYYDEIEKPAEALRVLDLGLAASVVPDLDIGADRVFVLVERGAALMALHRNQEALDNEDRVLKMNDLDDHIKAVLQRGRGFTLTELGKLDDAEEAYKTSLNYDPENEHAKSELRYIAGLKLGATPSTASALTKVQKTPDAPPTPSGTPQ